MPEQGGARCDRDHRKVDCLRGRARAVRRCIGKPFVDNELADKIKDGAGRRDFRQVRLRR
jgi:hypothetical protein